MKALSCGFRLFLLFIPGIAFGQGTPFGLPLDHFSNNPNVSYRTVSPTLNDQLRVAFQKLYGDLAYHDIEEFTDRDREIVTYANTEMPYFEQGLSSLESMCRYMALVPASNIDALYVAREHKAIHQREVEQRGQFYANSYNRLSDSAKKYIMEIIESFGDNKITVNGELDFEEVARTDPSQYIENFSSSCDHLPRVKRNLSERVMEPGYGYVVIDTKEGDNE